MGLLKIATETAYLLHSTSSPVVHLFFGSKFLGYFDQSRLCYRFLLEIGSPEILQNYLTHYREFEELVFGPCYLYCFYSRYSIKHSNFIEFYKGGYLSMDSVIISFAHFHLSLITVIPNY